MKEKLTGTVALILILLLVQCGSSTNSSGNSGGSGSSNSNAQANTNITYRGLWAPSLTVENSHDTDDPDYLTNNGFNLVSVIANVVVNSEGNITDATTEEELTATIDRYQAQNFQILLSVALVYSASGSMEDMAGATIFQQSTSVDIESVLEDYESYVTQFAEYAAEKDVDIFVPMNEADLTLATPTEDAFTYDHTLASNWGQSILTTIEATSYTGLILYKTGQDYSNKDWELDLTGYDMVGVSISPAQVHRNDLSGVFAEDVDQILNKMNTAAEEDGVEITLVTEFGVWGLEDDWDDSEYAEVYQTVFQQAETSVDGFIAFDNPNFMDGGSTIYGTGVETVIQSYFLTQD